MEILDEFEFDSEAYTSLWLTQSALERWNTQNLHPEDIENIQQSLQNPHIFLFRNTRNLDKIEDLSFLVNGSYTARRILPSLKDVNDIKLLNRPFTVVVILNPSGQHGECRLSEIDIRMLDSVKCIVQQIENVAYVVTENRHSAKYDEVDLQILSREIQGLIYTEIDINRIFSKIFLQHDSQLPIRIGFCLQNSIFYMIKRFEERLQDTTRYMSSELERLTAKRDKYIEILKEKISRKNISIFEFFCTKKQDAVEATCNYLLQLVEKSGLLKNFDKSDCNIADRLTKRLQTRFETILTKTKIPSSINLIRNLQITKASTSYRYNTRSSTSKAMRSIMPKQTKFRRKGYITKTKNTTMVKELYAEFLDVLTENVKKNHRSLTTYCKAFKDEFISRENNLVLHEWKTVSERNVKVKGFGYIDGIIHIYLKEDNEKDKTAVNDYIKQFFPQDERKQPIQIEYRQRKLTLFSKIQQGSQVNRSNGSDGKKIKYGTLGMFLEDKNEKYFFTTCAHVIGENDIAYSPHDNSALGKNVLVCDSSIDGITGPYIDLSLIHVSPDKNLTCLFGLKTKTGNFVKGQIFRGHVSEIVNCNIYKWGASKPQIKTGKCTGYEEEQPFLFIEVDNKDFGAKGDSGSIICVGDNIDTGLAAFVLVGGSSDQDEKRNTLLVYKVSDALEKVAKLKGEMKPCLIPQEKTVIISSPLDQPKTSPKRKSDTKAVEPKQKHRSPPK